MTSVPGEPTDPSSADVPPHFSRELILDEAIILLEEHGTLGFRLYDLAERLGVTVSALYYHFRNRDAIIEAAFLEVFRRDTALNFELATTFAHLDLGPHEKLGTLTTLVERLRREDARSLRRTRLRALTGLSDDPKSREQLAASMGHTNDASTAAFRDAQQRGVVRDDLDPRALALFARILLTGVIVWDYDQSITVTAEQFARVLEAVLAGLAGPSAT